VAEFTMPALGADMTEGTVVEWLVAPGDVVHRGDVIAVVDTEKAVIDVECFESGVLGRILVDVGHKVPVGTPLAVIVSDSAAPPSRPVPAGPPPASPAGPAVGAPEPRDRAPSPRVRSPLVRMHAADAGVDLRTVTATGPGGQITQSDLDRALHSAARPVASARLRVTPYARRLAADRGIDLATVRGSGRDGLVRARDLPRTGAAPARHAAAADADPRRATAVLMARSKREIPHYYLGTQVDLTAALDALRAHNRAVPVPDRVLPAAVLLRAVALGLNAVPELNGHWVDDAFRPCSAVHLGVAVSLRGGGLVVPVLRDAESLDLDALMRALAEAAGRARTGHLRSSEVSGATATVTNLGELGVDTVVGVIHPPQVALVGIGAVRPRPWVVDGGVVVRSVVDISLAADHRASDGATGSRLLREIGRLLGQPGLLLTGQS
jgi:pyruvate dehydrogenase E2 component (dihydrolipoamide acetyltransferase)